MTFDDGLVPRRKKKIFAAIGALLGVAAMAGGVAAWWMLRPGPFGMETRVPWTTSKIVGSPDPADPFLVERIYPAIKFTRPVDIAFAPGGKRIVVVEQEGKLLSFPNETAAAKADLLLDLTAVVGLKKMPGYHGVEAFGVTFDPDFKDNHFCYVSYRIVFPKKRTAFEYAKQYPQNKDAARVSRFFVTDDDPPVIDPRTETILISWPGGGHNGGCIKFGPDRLLYISTGDNGDFNTPDPFNIGQDVSDLRGKILRIDVHPPTAEHPYSIPTDNPFNNTREAQPEVFAYGLQNPRRFSFDRDSGSDQPWVADVGWESWETVHHITGGGNYGWSITSGPQPVHPAAKPGPSPIIPPVLSLPHTEAGAIIGGYVYRRTRLPELTGQYIFGDFETRRLWAASLDGFKLGKYRQIAQTGLRIIAFAEDADGELVILDYDGGLYRIEANSKAGTVGPFPARLSETGLFVDVPRQQPSPGVIPFDVIAPQWMDNATSEHFVAIPGNEPVVDNDDGARVFPKNTVLVRTFSLPMVAGDATSRRKIETQLLHYDGQFWHGYSYKWDDSQTDAMLVDEKGLELPLSIVDPAGPGGKRPQTWHFNSRSQCLSCHNKWSGYALAFNEEQLDRTEQYHTATHGVVADNQLRSFRHIGLIPTPAPPGTKEGASASRLAPVVLTNPYEDDPHHTLDDRARSYLHVNCSVCHRPGASGNSIIDLSRSNDLRETRLISEAGLGSFDLPDSQIVCPGDPSRSVLYFRMARMGTGHMPSLGPSLIDDPALELMAKWIVSLRGTPGTARVSPDSKEEQSLQRSALQTLQNGAVGDTATAAMEKLLSSPDAGLKLLTALQDGRIASNLRQVIAQRAMNATQDSVRDLFSRFLADRESYLAKLGNNPDIAKLLATPGNAERGRKIFFTFNGGLCGKCHVIGKQGFESGPNLNLIGAKYSKADILDNILHPSKSIVPGYETYIVRTKSEPSKPGDTFVGFLVSKSDAEVVLKDLFHKLIPIRTDDIEKISIDPKSAMPEDLLTNLDMPQVADLLEFLASRK